MIYSPLSFSVEVGDSERVEQVLSHACASAIVMSNMTCQAMNMFSSSSTLYVLLLHFLCFAPHLLCPPCPLSPLSRNRSVPDSSNDLEQMVAPPPALYLSDFLLSLAHVLDFPAGYQRCRCEVPCSRCVVADCVKVFGRCRWDNWVKARLRSFVCDPCVCGVRHYKIQS